jgi:hypothetical protein
MSNSSAETATSEEVETMIALQRLLKNGFIAVPYGDDPSNPDELGFVRLRWDIHETVRVYGADQAEAVRVVGMVVKERASGHARDVVKEVLDWPLIVSASGGRIK